jgi:hypothetical protein
VEVGDAAGMSRDDGQPLADARLLRAGANLDVATLLGLAVEDRVGVFEEVAELPCQGASFVKVFEPPSMIA